MIARRSDAHTSSAHGPHTNAMPHIALCHVEAGSCLTTMSLDTFDPNQAENLPEIEKQIAVRCVEHAQTYWNLLEKVKGSALRLTKYVAMLT